MREIEVSVAQGKKEFTKIIRESCEEGHNIIVTKRGRPAAVIMPFDNYKKLKQTSVLSELMDLRKRLSISGITAQEVYEESKRKLEERE